MRRSMICSAIVTVLPGRSGSRWRSSWGSAQTGRTFSDRACDLGLAFQLTNIARDVMDDARAGRVYLPSELFRRESVTPAFVLDPANHAAVLGATHALLELAERYYASARVGIARPALAFRLGDRDGTSGLSRDRQARAFFARPLGASAFGPALAQALACGRRQRAAGALSHRRRAAPCGALDAADHHVPRLKSSLSLRGRRRGAGYHLEGRARVERHRATAVESLLIVDGDARQLAVPLESLDQQFAFALGEIVEGGMGGLDRGLLIV